MKLYAFILISFLFVYVDVSSQDEKSVQDCINEKTEGCSLLKMFDVDIEATKTGKPEAVKYTVKLTKNSQYRFSICSAGYKTGSGIIELYKDGKRIASTYNTREDKDYMSFDFKCQRTGNYHMLVSFRDGKEGSAKVLVSFVRMMN